MNAGIKLKQKILFLIIIALSSVFIFMLFHSQTVESKKNISQLNEFYNRDSVFKYLRSFDATYLKASENDLKHITLIIRNATLHKDSNLMAFSYYIKGSIHRVKEQYDSAFVSYEKALVTAEELKNDVNIANIKLAQGNYYIDMDNYSNAIECYTSARNIYEKADTNQLPKVYNGLGIIYVSLGEYNLAIEYYKKALAVFKKQKDEQSIAGVSLNMVECYIKENDFATASGLLKNSERIFKKKNNLIDLSNCYSYYGQMYNAQNMIDSSLKYHYLSLKLANEVENERLIGTAYQNIGLLYQAMGKAGLAKNSFEQAQLSFRANKFKRGEMNAIFALSELYRDAKDWQNAYKHYINYINMRDSIINSETQSKIFEYEWKYKEQERKLNMNILIKN